MHMIGLEIIFAYELVQVLSKNNRRARCRLHSIAMSPIANLVVNMYNS
jgi:hypothetical protein